jgi:hypothetical protein
MKIEEYKQAQSLAASIASDGRWPALRESLRRLVKHSSDPSSEMACHRHGVAHGINTVIFHFEEAKSNEVQEGLKNQIRRKGIVAEDTPPMRDADLNEED